MDWETLAEALRNGMRPASLFVGAFIAVLLSILFWPYSVVVIAWALPYGLAKAWQRFRQESASKVSELPPLCREDWRRARSKLKKGRT